jgi:hypothetical protein
MPATAMALPKKVRKVAVLAGVCHTVSFTGNQTLARR